MWSRVPCYGLPTLGAHSRGTVWRVGFTPTNIGDHEYNFFVLTVLELFQLFHFCWGLADIVVLHLAFFVGCYRRGACLFHSQPLFILGANYHFIPTLRQPMGHFGGSNDQ